jgi:glyoxylase-like metal-dependent hydrolase (beta-lactamase superfamily II)
MALGDIGEVRVSALAPRATSPAQDWRQVLARAPAVKLTAFVTGWVEAGPEILIDADDPRTPANLKRRLWVPSMAYLLEHPSQGRLLLDTGLRAGACAYGTRPLYWVPCRNQPGSDVAAQLRARGSSPKDLAWIVMSHFHGDHASGLEHLLHLGASKIATLQEEIDDVQGFWRPLLGYESEMLGADMQIVTVNALLQPMPQVGVAVDFLGDGSFWLIPTPGHTRGHLAMLANTRPRPTLMTFDAAHLAADFELGIAPGATVDHTAAHASIAKLRALAREIPDLVIVYGHEPTQWDGVTSRQLGNGQR